MYKIEKTSYGLCVRIAGIYAEGELARYVAEKEAICAEFDKPYSMLVDLREAIPPSSEDHQRLQDSQRRQLEGNLERIAIVVISPILEFNARQVGFSAGTEDATRFINANRNPDWEKQALRWVIHGLEPELVTPAIK